MSTLQNLLEALNGALEETLSLDEKIVSKKARRRKRKKLKKLQAQKAAEQKAAQEQAAEQDSQEEDTNPGTALVVYDNNVQPEDENAEICEEFKNLMSSLHDATAKHQEDLQKADALWKEEPNKSCPQEAWDIYNNSVTELQTQCKQLIDGADISKFTAEELQTLDIFTTALDGYLEKAQQQITAIKPNLSIEDLGGEEESTALVPAQGTEITQKTGTALATTTGTALTTTDGGMQQLAVIADQEDEPEEEKKTDKKREKIMDYEMWNKTFGDLQDKALPNILSALGKVLNATIDLLRKIAGNVAGWFDDRIWAIITSPVTHDMVATFMYCNPITAMLFDGKFGNFGLKDGINKVRQQYQKTIQTVKGGDKKGDVTKQNPDNYTKRKFPKDISNLTLKQLRREFYGNKALVDFVNVAYNHPDVKTGDKANLSKYCTTMSRAFKTKKIETVRSTFSNVLKTANTVCDYMDWPSPIYWQNLITKYVKANGNDDKERQKIKNKNKPKKKAQKDTHEISDKDYQMLQQLKQLQDNQKQESYNMVEELEQLLEQAQR